VVALLLAAAAAHHATVLVVILLVVVVVGVAGDDGGDEAGVERGVEGEAACVTGVEKGVPISQSVSQSPFAGGSVVHVIQILFKKYISQRHLKSAVDLLSVRARRARCHTGEKITM
jgi:hypothetical protein